MFCLEHRESAKKQLTSFPKKHNSDCPDTSFSDQKKKRKMEALPSKVKTFFSVLGLYSVASQFKYSTAW